MIFNLNEFFSLQQSLNEREKHIAKLESELARMKEERDAWKARANNSYALTMDENTGDGELIVISRQKLQSILSKINDVKMLAMLHYVFHKILPDNTSADDCKAISNLFPEPNIVQPTLTAEGDLKVEGNWNDIHDNQKVNI